MTQIPEDVVLSIQNVSKTFPGVKALDSVSMDIRRGEVHGIVGENGAGKSTLMKILSGVYKRDAGTIIFDGNVIESTTPLDALKMGLSIIYQEFSLINTMTVGENIFLGRFRESGGMTGTHKKARALLDSIGSTINSRALVGTLSAAEKQMVEIAKALSFHSKLIIMDEPSTSLTTDELKHLFSIITELRQKGITVIYISHKLDEIFALCDHVTVMRDGKVTGNHPIEELTRNIMISEMIGRSIDNEYPERPRCAGEVLLDVRKINSRKLHDISFQVRRGEILGLVGLVGAGRTEIIRAIVGADKVKECELYLDGERVEIRSPIQAKKAGFGLVPEDRKTQGLILPFSVETNIVMAGLYKLTRFGILSNSSRRNIALKQMEALQIKTPNENTRVETLSGGNQQKCVLGRWLELSPRILILDEPTRGIDVGAKYEIYLLLKKIAEQGSAVIMISSELPEVLNMSNRVITVCDGRITGEFDPEVSTSEQIMEKALG